MGQPPLLPQIAMSNPNDQSTTSQPPLIAAVFDVDRTLVPVTTTERLFIRYLLRTHVIGWSVAIKTALFVWLDSAPTHHTIRGDTPPARIPARAVLQPECSRWRSSASKATSSPGCRQAGLDAIEEHRTQGHMIVLLSGSLDFLLQPLKEYVGADHLIAARAWRS